MTRRNSSPSFLQRQCTVPLSFLGCPPIITSFLRDGTLQPVYASLLCSPCCRCLHQRQPSKTMPRTIRGFHIYGNSRSYRPVPFPRFFCVLYFVRPAPFVRPILVPVSLSGQNRGIYITHVVLSKQTDTNFAITCYIHIIDLL